MNKIVDQKQQKSKVCVDCLKETPYDNLVHDHKASDFKRALCIPCRGKRELFDMQKEMMDRDGGAHYVLPYTSVVVHLRATVLFYMFQFRFRSIEIEKFQLIQSTNLQNNQKKNCNQNHHLPNSSIFVSVIFFC